MSMKFITCRLIVRHNYIYERCRPMPSQAPTQLESTALETYRSQMERVRQLVGFSSVAGLLAFQCGAEFTEASDVETRPRRKVTRSHSSTFGRSGLRSRHESKPTSEDESAADARPRRGEKNKNASDRRAVGEEIATNRKKSKAR